jgi:hypothetical protein
MLISEAALVLISEAALLLREGPPLLLLVRMRLRSGRTGGDANTGFESFF